MRKIVLVLLCLVLGPFASVPALAAAGPLKVHAVEVELIADRAQAVPGTPLRIALRLRHDRGWHTYWRNPGDSGLPTTLEPSLPAGWSHGPLQWPAPSRHPVGPLMNFGYDGEILLPMAVSVPADASPGTVTIGAKASWLMCRDVCIPGDAELSLELPVRAAGAGGQAAPAPWSALFDAMDERIPRSTLDVRVSADAGTLSIAFDRADTGTAEFYPVREGWLDNPAPQVLYRTPSGARLDARMPSDVRPDVLEAALSDPAIGVLVLDGRPLELRARRVATMPRDGVLVWSTPAAVAPSAAPTGRPAGGLLGAASSALPADAGARAADAGIGGETGGASIWLALIFGFVGGAILNLMPCVFPVIGLKILGFASHGPDGDPRRSGRAHAVAFALGIVVSFWMLAGLLLALRAAGQAVGWGFQLQSPVFVATMALLFVAIGLNLSGVYEIGAALTRLGGLDPALRSPSAARSRNSGSLASFASGVLAVLVATPCTAPFMGSALGFTLGQPAAVALLVFTAVGLGMAAPYVIVAAWPALLARLPRPGPWMQSLRQVLAFPMYATSAWLGWVLGQQAGIDAAFALALGAVVLAFAAWTYGRFVRSDGSRSVVALGVTLAALLAAGWVAFPAASDQAASSSAGTPSSGATGAASRAGGQWAPWSDAAVAQARAAGQAVLVDFTAAWCVTCQANKKLVLDREPVASALRSRQVVMLRADWTQRDPAIGEALARHGRSGVPLYLLYTPDDAPPRVLPEILTSGIVLQAIDGMNGLSSAR